MFENLEWKNDRMLMDEWVFRLQHHASDDWDLGTDCFIFFKIKDLVDQYESFFASRPNFRPQHVVELGLWDGGSMAFWYEHLRPLKQIGIDLQSKTDSDYFRKFVTQRNIENDLKTYWGVNQADSARLNQIVETEFDGPLDLVIDDASHLYGPTRASFETLFPLLRQGGLYIIEDWAWEHWRDFNSPTNPMSKEEGLTDFVFDLVQATGTSTELIRSVTVYQGFTVVERGSTAATRPGEFALANHIWRKPNLARAGTLRKYLKSLRRGAS